MRELSPIIPDWMPRDYVDGFLLAGPQGKPSIQQLLETERGLRFVCYVPNRDLQLWVPRRWYWYARIEYWYYLNQSWPWRLALRYGFLRLTPGDFYVNGKWTVPWSRPFA